MIDRTASLQLEQKRRLGVIGLVLLVFFAMLVGRLMERQILQHGYYLKMALQQRLSREEVPAKRGKILVSERNNGEYYPLATNVVLYSLQVVPRQVKHPDLLAGKLMPYLEGSGLVESDLIAKFKTGASYLPPLKRKFVREEAEKILALNEDGVFMVPEKYRYNPEEKMAAQLLGFVNRDGEGQYGLEAYFDEELGGKAGFLEAEKDTFGTPLALGRREAVDPQDGLDIVISVDRAIQYYVETALKDSVEKFKAEKGSVIIMEPGTGKIIAMAAYPSFDPNNYNKEKVDLFTNMNTAQVYEPGSVFKVITMAAGLDSGVIGATSTYVDSGEVVISDRTIRNSDKLAHGTQTMTQALEKSLNTGMIFIVQKLGKSLFKKYLEQFGFTQPTGVELAGEVGGQIKEITGWGEIDLATMSFGQGIAITPMQMVAAVGAIANKGKMVKPHIVDKIIYPSGAVSVDPQEVRQVIKPTIAEQVTAMMVAVVENGHGKKAGVPGYWIAGKTGTAQVPKPTGGYESSATIGSFVGFGPVKDPKFVMITRIDKPQGVSFAESTAAPLFGNIARFLLDYWHVAPER